MEDIVRAMTPDVYRYAYWLCRDRSVAEDLTQETFLRAWASLASLRDPGAVKAWLLQIARNEYLRRLQRRRPEVDESVALEDLSHAYEADYAGDMDVRHALGTLPVSLREPLVLQVLGGYTGAEIGTMIGVSEDAALTRIARAKLALRKLLQRPLTQARKRKAL